MSLYERSNLKFYTPTRNAGGIKVNVQLSEREEWVYCLLLFSSTLMTCSTQAGGRTEGEFGL